MKSIYIISLITLLTCSEARRLRKIVETVTLIQSKQIGEGGFGKVYALVKSEPTKKISDFVVKVVKLDEYSSKSGFLPAVFKTFGFKHDTASFKKELKILKHLADFKYEGKSNMTVFNDSVTFNLIETEVKRFEKQISEKPVSMLLFSKIKDNKGYLVMPK